ncbi:MAG: hypothetical protein NVV60_05515 [Luteimonas sp.]|nr:hypothetical protein [Luteimonas sp.]
MSFSLYRCGDDTCVVVPQALSPPIDAIHQYGNPTFVRALPREPMDSVIWDRVSGKIDGQLYAVIAIEEMEEIFEAD